MSESDVDELVQSVSRRRPLLDALRAGTTTKADLVASLDASRSTIDRAVRELESENLVTRTHGHVCLTLSGRLVLDAYNEFREIAVGVTDAADLLAALPADAPLNADFFAGARVIDADQAAPYRPVSAIEDVIRNADVVRTYATSIVPALLDAYVEELTADSLDLDIVVTDPVLDSLVAEHADALQTSLDSGHLKLAACERCIPFGFLVADCPETGRTGIVAAGDHGYVAIAENDHTDAVDWLDQLFTDVRADAQSVETTSHASD